MPCAPERDAGVEGDAEDRRRRNRKCVHAGGSQGFCLRQRAAEEETIVQETGCGFNSPSSFPLAARQRISPVSVSSPTAAANMTAPQGETPGSNHSAAAGSSKASELARLCAALGMAPPDFSFIGKQQVTKPPVSRLLPASWSADSERLCRVFWCVR